MTLYAGYYGNNILRLPQAQTQQQTGIINYEELRNRFESKSLQCNKSDSWERILSGPLLSSLGTTGFFVAFSSLTI